jgi:hypothetical protein
MLADGASYTAIERALLCYRDYINRWRRRFLAQRIDGLQPRHYSQPPSVLTPEMSADLAKDAPTPARWQYALEHPQAGAAVEDSSQPHRGGLAMGRAAAASVRAVHMQSDDPDFERKAADVIGLYVNPPDHAAVFAVGEKTAIQALDRLDPVLPLSPGRAERHGFEYYRYGTLSLFAALNTQTGEQPIPCIYAARRNNCASSPSTSTT